MKKNYIIPESKVRLTKIRTLLLSGSNDTIRPDGTQRPGNTAGTPVGNEPTDHFDARKRMPEF